MHWTSSQDSGRGCPRGHSFIGREMLGPRSAKGSQTWSFWHPSSLGSVHTPLLTQTRATPSHLLAQTETRSGGSTVNSRETETLNTRKLHACRGYLARAGMRSSRSSQVCRPAEARQEMMSSGLAVPGPGELWSEAGWSSGSQGRRPICVGNGRFHIASSGMCGRACFRREEKEKEKPGQFLFAPHMPSGKL